MTFLVKKPARRRNDVFTVAVRPVYSRNAQMPTVSGYIGIQESLYGQDVQFKRDTPGRWLLRPRSRITEAP